MTTSHRGHICHLMLQKKAAVETAQQVLTENACLKDEVDLATLHWLHVQMPT